MTDAWTRPPPVERDGTAAEVNVFVCRTFSAPASPQTLCRTLALLNDDLLDRDVRALSALRSSDGRRLLWHLRSRELGSVEAALSASPLARARLWHVRLQELQPELTANVVVEHPLDGFPSRASDLVHELQRFCLTTHRVVPVRLAMSRDGRHAFAFYRAPDAESVRLTQRHAGVPAGHAWAFDVLTDGRQPASGRAPAAM